MQKDIEVAKKILIAAKIEFGEAGFQGTRMSRIAERAGVNKALIHYYYIDKKKLYREVVKMVFGINSEATVPIISGKWELSVPQKLYAVIYFLFNLYTRATDPALIRFYFWELVENQTPLTNSLSEYLYPKLELILRVVNEGIASGIFESCNPNLVIMDIFYFPLLYLARSQIVSSNKKSPAFFLNETPDSVLEFMSEKLFKMLTPEGKSTEHPALPADFVTLLDSMIEFLKDRREEGAAFKVVSQLETIIY